MPLAPDWFELPPSQVAEQLASAEWYELERVRFVANNRAVGRQVVSREERLTWGRVAIECIVLMQTRPLDPRLVVWPPDTDHESYFRSELQRHEMRLRATLIGTLGPETGHDLLDPDVVADWFLASVSADSIEQATADASRPWEEIGIERIRQLRTIKIDLGVIALLSPNGHVMVPPPRAELLRRWLDIRSTSP